MDSVASLLLGATVVSAFNTGLQYYTQVSTYPLFAALPRDVFAAYHRAYERRLTLAIYVPFAVSMALGLALLVLPPPMIGRWPPAAMLTLNLAIAPVSVLLAVPTHKRLSAQGHADPAGIQALLRANALRLMVSAAATMLGMAMIASVWR